MGKLRAGCASELPGRRRATGLVEAPARPALSSGEQGSRAILEIEFPAPNPQQTLI